MKIGVFDSGLGGLLIHKAITTAMPQWDTLYYGDTLHLPYGNRSAEAIYHYTRRAMDQMFAKDCTLIIVACNTASAACLRRLQQGYLPAKWPGRNILGVVVPTLEAALDSQMHHIGLIATNFIVHSDIYQQELQKINPAVRLQSLATPLLVPLIENEGDAWLDDVLRTYLDRFDLDQMQGLILGCTHYVRLKERVKKLLPAHVHILSQDEIIPAKLDAYLQAHPEYASVISKSGAQDFYVSDLTPSYQKTAADIYERPIEIKVIRDDDTA